MNTEADWINVKDRLPEDSQKVLIAPTDYEPDWDNNNQSGVIVWALYFDPYGSGKPKFHFLDYKSDCYCEMKKPPKFWQPLPIKSQKQ